MLDLFRLHVDEEDIGPRSWIKASGTNLIKQLNSLIKDLEESGLNKHIIARKIAKSLICHEDTIEKIFYGEGKWVHLPVLIQVLGIWQKELSKTSSELEGKKHELCSYIEYIKTGNSLHILKAVKELNDDFCKIVGAHAADGCSIKRVTKNGCSYRIIIIDEYKSNLQAFGRWVGNIFGIKCKIKKDKQNKAWKITLDNKVIGRYLKIFFNFPAGRKARKVEIPQIIKEAEISFQKSFLSGVFTFDGCVETDKRVSIGLGSEKFIDEISKILKNFNIYISPSNKSGFFHLVSPKLDKKDDMAWINFFEAHTEKWYKLKELLLGFEGKVNSFESAIEAFDKTYKESGSSKIRLTDLIFILKDMKTCDKYILYKKLGVGISTLYRYIHILIQANILERTKTPSFISTLDYFHPTFTRVTLEDNFRNKIFEELNEKYSRKDLTRNLGICEETLKNWIKGKHKIPIDKLQKILTMLDIIPVINLDMKSFNRLVFVYNPNVSEWKVPWRPWFKFVSKIT